VNKQDTLGVIAPPPLIYLAGLVIGLILGYLAPAWDPATQRRGPLA
jgi:hypothetical protein